MSIELLTHPKVKRQIDEICMLFSSLGEVYFRAQFGNYGLCCGDIMFALVSKGELYLRSCEELIPYFKDHQMQCFIYDKRGLPILMQYYLVNETLWQKPDELINLAVQALSGARRDKKNNIQQKTRRIKDLPNLNISIEKHLRRLKITTVELLKQLGAKRVYLMLLEINVDLGLKLLLALEGAITGCHMVALPKSKQSELVNWWNRLQNQKNQIQSVQVFSAIGV